MRKKANSQNRPSNTSADMAMPPSRCASPSRPIAAVPTMPSSGVVRFASIAGPAMAKTRALVTAAVESAGSMFDLVASGYRPLAARVSRTISQIGTTTAAPSSR